VINIELEKIGLSEFVVSGEGHDENVVVTDYGKTILETYPQMMELILKKNLGKEFLIRDSYAGRWERPGLRSRIYRTTLKNGLFGRKEVIAIKEPLDSSAGRDSTAMEQAEALEAIRSSGFSVIPVLMALEKKNRLILEWYVGEHPYTDVQLAKLGVYLALLDDSTKELQNRGIWNSEWRIDRQPWNYFVGDLDSGDVHRQFVVLDPLYRRSLFIFD